MNPRDFSGDGLDESPFPPGTYHNPTPESLAAEVADEARIRDEMAEEAKVTEQAVDIQTLIQNEVAKVAGSLVQQAAQQVQPQSFEEALAQVDPADSEAALEMLDWLLKTGRLGRVGVLDGGQGYLFMYQEPKGSTKQGYRPGATQGDRIVDEAVEAQRAAGKAPAKRGMCPHCFSVVKEIESRIVLDDSSENEVCSNSPDGKHAMA